jgi:serine/threonine-protein kinase
MLKEGSQIDRFIVEQEIGSGGMATVYRARHASLGTLHAIKILGADLAKDATLRRRFLAEGRIQARLSHPNIVRVTDTVEHGELAGLVMDLVEGETLTRFLRRFEGPPDAKTIREIFLQVLSAVGYAHQQGVIHRDLKPSNILVEDRSQGPLLARVLDFGIAKVMLEEADGAPLTSTGMVLGTPSYMSPEQVINARHVTPRSDIFSLGAVLYAFATRRRPFEGNTEYIVMRAIERCTFLPPEQVHPGIDKLIAQAITRAMLSEPSQRFASCEEFAAALAGKRKKAERRVPEPEPEPDPDVDIEERPTDLDVGRPPGLRRTTEVEAPACPEPEEKADFTPGAVAFEMEVEEAFDQEEVVAEEVVVKPKSLFKPAVTRQVERRKKVTRTRVVHRKAEGASSPWARPPRSRGGRRTRWSTR